MAARGFIFSSFSPVYKGICVYPRPRSTSVNSTDTRKFVSKVLTIKVDLICAVIIEMKITTKLAKQEHE